MICDHVKLNIELPSFAGSFSASLMRSLKISMSSSDPFLFPQSPPFSGSDDAALSSPRPPVGAVLTLLTGDSGEMVILRNLAILVKLVILVKN